MFTLESVLRSWFRCESREGGDILSWTEAEWTVNSSNQDLDDICEPPKPGIVFMDYDMSYEEGKILCNSLQATFVNFDNITDIEYAVAENEERSAVAENEERSNSTEIYWTGYKFNADQRNYKILNGADFNFTDKWSAGEPNGKGVQTCVVLLVFNNTYSFKDEYCTDKYKFFCRFEELPTLYLQMDRHKYQLDSMYKYDIELNTFRGVQYGNIEMLDDTWKIVSHEKDIIASTSPIPGLPLGNKTWNFVQNNVSERVILHACKDRQFPCQNGICLNEIKRCDSTFDCKDYDTSDEDGCNLIEKVTGYTDIRIPSGVNGTLFTVKLGFKMIDILSVDMSTRTFEMKFQIQTKWRDTGLRFKNLKDNTMNVLDSDVWKEIWNPNLLFVNTEGLISAAELSSNVYSFVFAEKKGSTRKRMSSLISDFVLMGHHVDIVKNSSYSQTFICEYDTVYYPFDIQNCFIELELYVADKSGLRFVLGDVEAQATFTFQDFDVTNWFMKEESKPFDSNGGHYQVIKVNFTLKRTLAQAFMKVFMPNIILLAISIITNYFLGQDMFDAVININATVLMTVASLFVDSSNYLPPSVEIK